MESSLDTAAVGSVKHSNPQEHIIAKAAKGTTIAIISFLWNALSDSISIDVFLRWIITARGR